MMNDYEFFTTDVLVVGGGCGGLAAALSAREQGVETMIVEKAVTGFAGQAPRAGNGILLHKPGQDLVPFYRYLLDHLCTYITDQDTLKAVSESSAPVMRKALKEWGVKLSTDENGDQAYWGYADSLYFHSGIELNMTESIRKAAHKAGVEMVNRTNIIGLIKNGNAVVGAAGFDVMDGHLRIFSAKAVLLSTSGCNFRIVRKFNGTGSGIRLAWDAGAQMRNAEFGNFYEYVGAHNGDSIYGSLKLINNARGENMWDKYIGWDAPDVTPEMVLGAYREYQQGNTPLTSDMGKLAEAFAAALGNAESSSSRFFPDKESLNRREHAREAEYLPSGRMAEQTISMHANLGCVRVDPQMATTVPGLYGAGFLVWNGCGHYGCRPAPTIRGNGLGFAMPTGYIGGISAAEYAKAHSLSPVPDSEVERFTALYKGLYHAEGEDAEQMILDMHKVVAKVSYSLYRSEERLLDGIEKIDALSKRAEHIRATDPHTAGKVFDIQSMLLSARLGFISALERQESRGYHFREDYPETDDQNWMKWVLVDNDNGRMAVSTEDVPLDRYPLQPVT